MSEILARREASINPYRELYRYTLVFVFVFVCIAINTESCYNCFFFSCFRFIRANDYNYTITIILLLYCTISYSIYYIKPLLCAHYTKVLYNTIVMHNNCYVYTIHSNNFYVVVMFQVKLEFENPIIHICVLNHPSLVCKLSCISNAL